MLNTEYKLIAKCLANRALKYMWELIHLDQTGFLPGRYIGENINKIISIIQQAEINGIPGILIAIDFEKAYNFLEWSFIEKTLEFFNFGTSYISWIKLYIMVPLVPLLTMDGFLNTLIYQGVLGKDAPSLLICLCWLQKYWLLI